jgi:ornithine decarboxylase
MMKLTSRLIQISQRRKTPFLLTDLRQISVKYDRLKTALPNTSIHYAVKSNNDLSLLKHLAFLGSNFDVASWNEIKYLQKLGVPPSKMVFSAPIKKTEDLKKAYTFGVTRYAFDSEEELMKIHHCAPAAKVILRIVVDGDGSQCPMHKKFGVTPEEAIPILKKVQQCQLYPLGLTFHVGSQCIKTSNWVNALLRANRVWDKARQMGIQLEVINVGGGLPVAYDREVPPIENILKIVKDTLDHHFVGLKNTYIEPGRYMTDQASVMVSTVIGKASRNEMNWIFLDVGGFNGLFEIFENFKFDIQIPHPNGSKKIFYAVGGPTCDGMDIIRKRIRLPEVNIGDRVYIMNAGAYSISIKQYNGLLWPKSVITN